MKNLILDNDKGIISVGLTVNNIDLSIDYILKNNIVDIFFENSGFKKGDDFSFLNKINITSISFIDDLIYLGSFPKISSVKTIFINKYIGKFDLSKLPNLEEITITWNPKLIFYNISTRLKKMIVWNYSTIDKKLNKLFFAPNLTYLELNKTNTLNLDGIQYFSKLSSFNLFYGTKLINTDDLKKLKSITLLLLDNCKKIESFKFLEKNQTIETLSLNNCGEIHSISFIKKMIKLKDFRFVGTNILDGDLSFCSKLENVGFSNKRHYNYSSQDFNKPNQL